MDNETSAGGELRDALKLTDMERLALRLPLMDTSPSAVSTTPGWSARFMSFASVVL